MFWRGRGGGRPGRVTLKKFITYEDWGEFALVA